MENFPKTGTERNRKAHGHATREHSTREQKIFWSAGFVSKADESGSTFLPRLYRKMSYDLRNSSDIFVC